eukprot:NODE_1162_length_482_cov_186.135211_g1152_i0.p2 GENE.NODE_1162_length_482_cov_186.135211_g1152_i0~~NODE_1162_length_482_cov_186.135211_g1152_i0.p2  ORF type:complete len:66 (-),score=19.98 NODE_1162_length_482_cov_186.135211_g1152_i0:167-364(-)
MMKWLYLSALQPVFNNGLQSIEGAREGGHNCQIKQQQEGGVVYIVGGKSKEESCKGCEGSQKVIL